MHGVRNVGGGEYSIMHLIKGLDRSKFEPYVFFSHENAVIRSLMKEGVSCERLFFDDNITSVYRDRIKFTPFSLFVYCKHIFQAVVVTIRCIKKHRIQLLHPHDNLSKIIAGLAAKLSGIKVVVHCRDLLKNGFVEKLLVYYQLLFAHKIITVSECNRRLFKIWTRIPDKVRTIYNGLDMADFVPKDAAWLKKEIGIGHEKTVLGVIGVFDKCKGHIYLLEAIKKLVSCGNKNISCLLVGDGREEGKLKHFVEENGLSSYVYFIGYRNDIGSLLNIIDIVVIPSIQESFPRVSLEAMAMARPVIATNIGGLPESVKDGVTGLIVKEADADALCSAIEVMLKNRHLAKKMGLEGRRLVEDRFDIKTNIAETEKVYLELLEGRQVGSKKD